MDASRVTRAIVIAAGLTALLPAGAIGQDAARVEAQGADAAATEAQAREAKGIPPRAAPGDYLAHAQAGNVTIAAEFKGHSIPTPEATFTSEDYVAVEVGLFGPPEARLKLSPEDFSLRVVNLKKSAGPLQQKKAAKTAPTMPTQPYAMVFKSLKDPSWEPPVKAASKSKTSIGGDGGNSSDPPPASPKMPFELVRAMDQKVQKASLPEGERALPQAGLIYFEYHGKTEGARSLQLIYSGPAGQATLELQP